MQKSNNRKSKWIWLSALFLFVCVVASVIVLMSQIDSFLPSDSGAIPLISENVAYGAPLNNSKFNNTADLNKSSDKSTGGQNNSSSETKLVSPGFEISDDSTVWSTNTQVEIFRVSYENGEQVITVNSDNGKKVIAPGTENSYTFKLKNTGNVALDYTVAVEAYFTPADIVIPITARINRYDGLWVAGDKNNYADISELNGSEDKSTLGAGRYSYYTLDWLWPYESGNDSLDTMLGNMAVNQDLTLTIVIKTTAQISDNPDCNWGIAPKTGASNNIVLWSALMAASFATIIILIVPPKKRNKRSNVEDKNS